MRPKQLYVVVHGKMTGIFDCWYGEHGAEVQVKGFSGAEYKGRFYSLDDAISYFEARAFKKPEVHFEIIEKNISNEPDGKKYITYILIDPRSENPFYVGQTSDYEKRKKSHLRIKENPFRKVDKYIYQLKLEELDPEFYVAEICNNLGLSLNSETKWVRYYLEKGYVLCNRWREHREIPK